MRISSNMSVDNSLYNIQRGRTRLDRLGELTSSGQNINRPSDDPAGARMLLDIGDKLKAGDQYLSNIKKSKTWQQTTDTALTGMAEIMRLAKQQVNAIYSGSSDTAVLQNAAAHLQTLKQQMIDLANTQVGDQYIFGGANSTTKPFSNVVSPLNPYNGDETALNVEIERSATYQMNIPGNQLLVADSAASTPYGNINILKTFDDLIAAVGSNDVAGIQAGSLDLDNGSKQISSAQSDVALRILRLDNMEKLNSKTRSTLESIYGDTQNVDYAKLAVQMNQQKIAFEASLSTTAKLSQLSLLNYM